MVVMNIWMTIVIVLANLFMLFIWSLCLISKKQEPRPSYESIEEKKWKEKR